MSVPYSGYYTPDGDECRHRLRHFMIGSAYGWRGCVNVLILIYGRTNVGRIVQPALGCVFQGFNPAKPGIIKNLRDNVRSGLIFIRLADFQSNQRCIKKGVKRYFWWFRLEAPNNKK